MLSETLSETLSEMLLELGSAMFRMTLVLNVSCLLLDPADLPRLLTCKFKLKLGAGSMASIDLKLSPFMEDCLDVCCLLLDPANLPRRLLTCKVKLGALTRCLMDP